MTTATKKSMNVNNWKLDALQLRAKLPRNYITFYVHYFPKYDNEQGKKEVRDYLNGRSYDKNVSDRLERLIKLIKVN